MASGNEKAFIFIYYFFELFVVAKVATIRKSREPNLATGQTLRRG